MVFSPVEAPALPYSGFPVFLWDGAFFLGASQLRCPEIDLHAGVSDAGTIIACPELCVFASMFKKEEADTFSEVGEDVGDLDAGIVIPLGDRIRLNIKSGQHCAPVSSHQPDMKLVLAATVLSSSPPVTDVDLCPGVIQQLWPQPLRQEVHYLSLPAPPKGRHKAGLGLCPRHWFAILFYCPAFSTIFQLPALEPFLPTGISEQVPTQWLQDA